MSVVSSRTVHFHISTESRAVNLDTYNLEPVLARPSRACNLFPLLVLIIITGLVCECLIIIRRVVEHRPTVLGRIRTLSIKWQGAHVN